MQKEKKVGKCSVGKMSVKKLYIGKVSVRDLPGRKTVLEVSVSVIKPFK